MLKIEQIEVHAATPLRKRERLGLSANDAYNRVSLMILI